MIGKRILTIIAYPITEELKVGHIDTLERMFINQKNLFNEVYVYSSNDPGKEWDIKEGIHIIRPNIKIPKPFNIIYEIIYLYFKFRKNKPDIIRALSPHTSGVVAFGLSKLLKVPFVTSVHADRKLVNKYEKNINWIYEKIADFIEKKIYEDSILIPVISHYIGDYVCSFGNFKEKLFLHRNWVDLNLFKPLKNKNPKNRVLFVGRLEKVKGVHILIHALNYVNEKISVIIVGKGGYEKELKKMAKKVNKDIIFTGTINHKTQLPKLMRENDIFVAPLSGGFSIIEAMASGLPVIAGDIEWSREVVKTGYNGILIKPNDEVKLAEAIDKLIKNKEFIKKLGENARKFAENEFDVKKWERREEYIYKIVMKKFKI